VIVSRAGGESDGAGDIDYDFKKMVRPQRLFIFLPLPHGPIPNRCCVSMARRCQERNQIEWEKEGKR
jgi:hypothetical protein